MSFATGSITFSRFGVRMVHRTFDAKHLELLSDHAIGSSRITTSEGIDTGWGAGQHCKDRDFTELKCIYPDHLAFDFVTELNRVPPERFRMYYSTELKALSSRNPSGYPSARQKREAKETARERLEQESKDGRYLRWVQVPVLWDSVRQEVLVGTTSLTVLDRFTTLFEKTFGPSLLNWQSPPTDGALHWRTAANLATAMNPAAKDAVVSNFTNIDLDSCGGVRWATFDDQPDFLGNEFLLWLWYRYQSDQQSTIVQDGSSIEHFFSGGMRLEHPVHKDNDTINSDSAIRKIQAFKAAANGYLPRRTALTLVRQGEAYSFKLNAETLAVCGLKLPKPNDDLTNPRDVQIDRFERLRDMTEALDLLYKHFVEWRLSPYWVTELADMRLWLAGEVVAA